MIVVESRPRNLNWYHAGPLLFGDWGTSRLYVLGLAFAFTGNGSVVYLGALSVLMALVAWAYSVICRCFPEGGGVYAAARAVNPFLGVVGATLLLADYIVTIAISLVEAYHYFGLPEGPGGATLLVACVLTIAALGVLNWFGARSAGRFALVIALLAVGFSLLVALMCLPYVPRGLLAIDLGAAAPPWDRWTSFVAIVLALSGLESVANLTGLMKRPVSRTARRTIWPVLAEVAVLNLVFGAALTGVVAAAQSGLLTDFGYTSEQIRNTAMKVLAMQGGSDWLGPSAGFVLGKVCAVVFGLLLLSAGNTAVLAMISVLYALGQDRELPRPLTKLNDAGVPALPLLVACVVPALVLVVQRDLEGLAQLYAIGVCGAITLNVGATAWNRRLDLRRSERAGLAAIGVLMGLIWLTIAVTKPNAAIFAGSLVAVTLIARYAAAARRGAEPVAEPALGWLAELRAAPTRLETSRRRIMLAARGPEQARFAVELARQRGAVLFCIFVRTVRVLDAGAGHVPRIEDDPGAQASLGAAAVLAREAGVPFFPIYVTSTDPAAEILDYTVTYGCESLIMGQTRRSLFSRRIGGDVVAEVARALPDAVTLITRPAATPPPEGSKAGATLGERPTEQTPHGRGP